MMVSRVTRWQTQHAGVPGQLSELTHMVLALQEQVAKIQGSDGTDVDSIDAEVSLTDIPTSDTMELFTTPKEVPTHVDGLTDDAGNGNRRAQPFDAQTRPKSRGPAITNTRSRFPMVEVISRPSESKTNKVNCRRVFLIDKD